MTLQQLANEVRELSKEPLTVDPREALKIAEDAIAAMLEEGGAKWMV